MRLALPKSRVEDGVLIAHAVYVDRYGNVGLDAGHDQLTDLGLRLGQQVTVADGKAGLEATYVRTFADVNRGDLLVYEDAYRRLSLAVSHGSAAERLGVRIDDELRIRT